MTSYQRIYLNFDIIGEYIRNDVIQPRWTLFYLQSFVSTYIYIMCFEKYYEFYHNRKQLVSPDLYIKTYYY
jgi:hypothetical protein